MDFWNDINYNPDQGNGQFQESADGTSPTSSDMVPEDESSSEDNVNNTSFDCEISIAFDGENANVSGSAEGVTIQKSGAYVTVNNSGDNKVKYILSGNSSNGCFKIYSSKKQAVILNNLTLSNPQGSALNNQGKKRTFIVLEGASTISDGDVGSDGKYQGESSEEDMKAAVFSEGQLIFSGSGSLTVNAKGKAGITSDDYVHFMENPEIVVMSSKGHGVRGKDAIIVSGGTLNVNLDASATGKKCLTTDSLIYINGGNTALVNKASAGTVESELTGAAGIKADKMFVIQGGSLSINSSGKGCKCINGDGNGFFEGGSVIAEASGSNYGSSGRYSDSNNSVSSKAIKFDGCLEFSGADVTVRCSSYEAIESKKTICISGGKISATSSDDAINSSSTMTITAGMVYAYSTGNDGLDANGNLVMEGGTVYAIGSGSPEVGIDANTEGGYRFYLKGGNVIAVGGIESNSSVSQAVISTSWTRNTTYSLCDGSETILSFKTPSSGGSGLFISTPDLTSGTSYSLKTAATTNGYLDGIEGILSIGGTSEGGSSSNISASDYSSNGGGMGGPGGQGGRPGWGW